MSEYHSSPCSCLLSNEKIGNAPCKTALVLPVRYALCSDKESKLSTEYEGFVRKFCPVPEAEPYYYTLRLLRPNSNLYIYAAGDDDISQFQVSDKSKLKLIKDGSGGKHFSAQDCYLQVANLNTQMWIAVSDANWTEDYRKTVQASPAQRMQEFNPQTQASEQSLVSKEKQDKLVTELSNLVQEFREQPGYLRAMHEYTEVKDEKGESRNIAAFLDTDLTHLAQPTADELLVEKRWHWSATTFAWKNSEGSEPLSALETQIQAQPCAMFVALADPVGMAMDCASLNVAAQKACTDVMTWYGPAFALAKKILGMAGFAADILCSTYDTITLFNVRNPGAAIGTALMGGASAAMWLMCANGIALVSFYTLGVAALLIIGFYVYYTFLDPKLLSFLKSCLWNRAFQAQRNALQGAFVPCLTDVAFPDWKCWNEHAANGLRDLRPPLITCKISEGLLSVHVTACGFNPKIGLRICLNYHGYNVNGSLSSYYSNDTEISENYLKDAPKEVFMGSIYNFDAVYDVKKFISDFSKQTYINTDPRSITVTVKYAYSPDMDATAVEMSVAFNSPNALTPIPRNELGYPYARTGFC